MSRRIAAAALVLFAVTAVPARADFDSIARAISAKRGVKRVSIPFLGLARLAVWVTSPSGVHDFQLATFEGGRSVNPRELQKMMRAQLDKGFMPLVQVWSKKNGGEWSFVYAKPSKSGNRMELLVLAHERDETTLVRVDVDAAKVARTLELSPRHVSRTASVDGGDDEVSRRVTRERTRTVSKTAQSSITVTADQR